MKAIVTFSGGKDSLASLIWTMKEFGIRNTEIVFCDTGWEHELTYKYIDKIIAQVGLPFHKLKSKKYNGMIDLATKKGRFPSSKARFCTEELKSKPMIDFVLDQNEDLLIIQGIRAGESVARSKMDKQCRYFKYYTEPYGYDKNGKPKYHNYRKKDVLKFRENYCDDILRPIFEWSDEETIQYILDNGFELNPLYYKGVSRVGCFPCIMCRQKEVEIIEKIDPAHLDSLEKTEKEIGSTFFPPDYIPKRYHSGKTETKDGAAKTFPTLKDVRRYIADKNATLDMFAEETGDMSCMSYYSICE